MNITEEIREIADDLENKPYISIKREIEGILNILHELNNKVDIVGLALTKQRKQDVIELKKCPFCGDGKIGTEKYNTGVYYCYCSRCSAKSAPCITKEGARNRWNERSY